MLLGVRRFEKTQKFTTPKRPKTKKKDYLKGNHKDSQPGEESYTIKKNVNTKKTMGGGGGGRGIIIWRKESSKARVKKKITR